MQRQLGNYVSGGLGKKINLEEAKAAEILLQYVEQQEESTTLELLNIRKWGDLSFRKSLKVKTQKTIMDSLQTLMF